MSSYANYSPDTGGGGSAYARAGSDGVTVGGPIRVTGGGAIHLGGGKKKKKGRGFWGDAAHVFVQGGEDIYHQAENIPGGLYHAGDALDTDIINTFSGHPGRRSRFVDQVIIPTAVSTYEDLNHPLRRPGNTLVDIIGLASLGAGSIARAGEVGRVVGAAADAGRAAKVGEIASVAVRGPDPGVVRMTAGGVTVHVPGRRGALAREAQKLLNDARNLHPEARGIGGIRNQYERVGKELAKTRRIDASVAKIPALSLAAGGKKLTTPQQVALRVVAEGQPIAARIRFHREQMAAAPPLAKRAIGKQIKLLTLAERYVHDVGGVPTIAPEYKWLGDISDRVAYIAGEREATLAKANMLAPETAAGRVSGPGRVIEGETVGAPVAPPPTPGQMTLLGDPAEGSFAGGQARIPYVRRGTPAALFTLGGFRGGIPRAPGSLTHAFTGALLRSGHFRNDTTRLVAESAIEAERYAGLLRARDFFIAHAHTARETEHDIPIRLDEMKGKTFPQAVQDAAAHYEEGLKLSKEETRMLGTAYETLRETVFPTGEAQGVMWIDRRLLGGLDKPNPLIGWNQHATGRAVLAGVDALNNASKTAVLYLKPAYAIPNLLGNAALTLLHQGFAAPRNLIEAARINARLGRDTAAAVDELMGEGISRAIESEAGVGQKAVNLLAGAWSTVVDVPFRRAAFLHEARRAGYKTPADVKRLVGDEVAHDDLHLVVRRATAALIDYSDLGPLERTVIRRVIYFYPWVKGATRYAGHMVAEHPVGTFAAAKAGDLGYEREQQDFGPLPSYLEGLLKVGGSESQPLVVNPAAAGILNTPAQVGAALAGLVHGNVGSANQLSQFFSPAANALAGVSEHVVGGRLAQPGESGLGILKRTLIEPTPQYQLGQRISDALNHKGAGRIYPPDIVAALAQYGIGGLAPRRASRAAINKAAEREKTGR